MQKGDQKRQKVTTWSPKKVTETAKKVTYPLAAAMIAAILRCELCAAELQVEQGPTAKLLDADHLAVVITSAFS